MTEENLCVRIVEDSYVLIEMLSVMLELEGVRYCTTNKHFEDLLGPKHWEGVTAVLCDLDLGGPITGCMILEYLRDNFPQIRRVVLSATSDQRVGAASELAHTVLRKPTDIEDIVRAIK